jgi:hypothetical protein
MSSTLRRLSKILVGAGGLLVGFFLIPFCIVAAARVGSAVGLSASTSIVAGIVFALIIAIAAPWTAVILKRRRERREAAESGRQGFEPLPRRDR